MNMLPIKLRAHSRYNTRYRTWEFHSSSATHHNVNRLNTSALNEAKATRMNMNEKTWRMNMNENILTSWMSFGRNKIETGEGGR